MHSNSHQEDEIYYVLHQVLSERPKSLREYFSGEFLQSLQDTSEEFRSNIVQEERLFFKGFPSGNFLKQISQVLYHWARVGSFPVSFRSVYGFDTETTCKAISDLSHLNSLVSEFTSNLHSQESYSLAESVLIGLGPRGFLFCLGLRKTQGSIDSFLPPSRVALEKAFAEMNTKEEAKGATLTVGARALSKHAHRSSDGFWGKVTGPELSKNNHANQLLQRMLDNCVWINIHCLPNEIPVLEIRVTEGYGVRWLLDKQYAFRGFLEPMMEGGHERGWRH